MRSKSQFVGHKKPYSLFEQARRADSKKVYALVMNEIVSRLNKIWNNYRWTIWLGLKLIDHFRRIIHPWSCEYWMVFWFRALLSTIYIRWCTCFLTIWKIFSIETQFWLYRSGTWVKSDEPRLTSGQVIPCQMVHQIFKNELWFSFFCWHLLNYQ